MDKKILRIFIVPFIIVLSMMFVFKTLSAYSQDAYREAEMIAEVRRIILSDYVEEVEPEKLLDGALNGMTSILDDYSTYLNEASFKEILEGTQGEFVGIGIEVTMENGLLTVISPIEGSPAMRSGIRAGDKIIGIDGVSTEGKTLTELVKRLKGKKGTTVLLSVIHEDSKTSEEISVIRDVVHVLSIKDVHVLDPEHGVGYLRLVKFNKHTGEELKNSIKKLRDQGLQSLIIDLRYNPGGLLDASREVVDLFITEGIIVYTKGRSARSHRVYHATSEDTETKIPLAILVNRRSASASEIVAGALQDYKRATVVGERTYGKGSVQTILELRDEKTAIKLTTAKYYTPSGRVIQSSGEYKGGVIPDVVVTLTEQEEKSLTEWIYQPKKNFQAIDRQLQKALDLLKGNTSNLLPVNRK